MTLLIHDAISSASDVPEPIIPKRRGVALALLTLGFGLVGLDRFMILPMFPVIAGRLHLDYQDIGLITGALSISWGLASIFIGNLADLFGPRRVAVV
jgi:MFS family permease